MKSFICGIALVGVLVSSVASSADTTPTEQLIRHMSGTWKQNEAKRKLGAGLDLRFRTNDAGQMEELRGPLSQPLVHPVRFDGTPYTRDRLTIVWKQTGPNTYERTLSESGKVITTRRIRVSSDGRSLTEEFERKLPDGKVGIRTAEFRRDSGEGKGLLGTWKIVSARNSEPVILKYESLGKSGWKVSGLLGQMYDLTLDGKPAPIAGIAVIPDMMISARQIDGNTIETTTTRQGVAANKSRIQLSDGGKVMTVTTTNVGPKGDSEPTINVFEKQ
jgi:hypothetical protein